MRHLAVMVSLIATALVPTARAESVDVDALNAGFTRHLAKVINDYRQRHRLPPLALAVDLGHLAGAHSADMAARRRLSHDGFDGRFGQSTSTLCVENVGWNHPTAEAVLDGWRRSPGHHRNLLDPKVTRMGLAVEARYVTYFACR